MKIATKQLASLLIITMLSLSTVNVSALANNTNQRTRENRFERLTRRHDRKMELTANIIGLTSQQLKDELKGSSFEQILKKHGFKTKAAFKVAMAGKLKDELKKRGWSDGKIQKVVEKRFHRLGDRA